jgi:hypothetical protein
MLKRQISRRTQKIMNHAAVSGLLITLLGDGSGVPCRDMPPLLVSALCALNMLLLIDSNGDLFASVNGGRREFKDYTIVTTKPTNVQIEFNDASAAEGLRVVPVADVALDEMRRMGNLKRLALVNIGPRL